MRLDDRTLARKLQETPGAEPPPELIDRLRADLHLVSASPGSEPSRHRPSRWLVAASLATVLGGGTLAWWVVTHAPELDQAPVTERLASRAAAPAEAETAAADAEPPAEEVREGAVPAARGETAERAESPAAAGARAATPSPASPPPPAVAESARRGEPVADAARARLEIRAVDEGDDPLPGVTITLDGPERRRSVADATGTTVFPGLPAGAYRIEGRLEGFATVVGEHRLAGGADATVVLRLPAAVEEVVTVTAESPRLDAQKLSVSPQAFADPAPAAPDHAAERRRVGAEGEAGRIAANEAAARPRSPGLVPPPPPRPSPAPPSTGGTAEPNDAPYGDVFFRTWGVNPFVDTEDDPLATFGLEIDTGSWGVVQRYLRDGHRPPAEAVRVEEIVNAFRYRDPAPRGETFGIALDSAPIPWESGARTWLLRVGIRARDVASEARRPANLTFVVDVSGSMAREDRLGLVRQSLRLLLDELRPEDRVALVVYGSEGRILLPHTSDHERIRAAVDRLVPEGATNAEEGLRLAYDLAASAFREGAVNRVLLCSDGVANVGRTGPESILATIGEAARRGIELTTVGFGMGNYNDVLMEQLADRGDGRYAYVDTLADARRLFVEELTGTLQTVAEEARAQVAFDPEVISRWRLLGYENRDIADERFRDDTVDAGEIGAGHAVTALFEVKLRPEAAPRASWGEVRVRYRPEGSDRFEEVARPIGPTDRAATFDAADADLRLAAVAARFAEVLRGSYWARGADLDQLLREARAVAAERADEPRAADLVDAVERLRGLEE